MKKSFINTSIFFITLFFTTTVFGDCQKCMIKDETPQILKDYNSNINKILENINNEVKKTTPNIGGYLKEKFNQDINIFSKTSKLYNIAWNWNSYESYFNFFVTYSISNEPVPQIWRDYYMLDNISAKIQEKIKNYSSVGYSQVILSNNICKDFENCTYSGDMYEVLTSLYINNERIKNYYRLSIMGKQDNFNDNIYIVPNNFKSIFNTFYNKNTIGNCSACEGNALDRINKSINKTLNFQENGANGFKDWKNAVDLMMGIDTDNDKLQEAKILEAELVKQGLSQKASKVILNNLKKYNEAGGFSLTKNNPIANSLSYITDSVTSQISDFKDSINENFKNTNQISVESLNKSITKLKTTKEVELRIKEIYYKELPFAQEQDNNSQNMIGQIFSIHNTLINSIKILSDTKKISQKVCNSQAQGKGICNTK